MQRRVSPSCPANSCLTIVLPTGGVDTTDFPQAWRKSLLAASRLQVFWILAAFLEVKAYAVSLSPSAGWNSSLSTISSRALPKAVT